MQLKHTYSGFSIIEILVGIFIFSLGITAIYTVIISSLNLNTYNKNFIIASNLAREQLELARNIRDSDYISIHQFHQINPHGSYTDTNNFFATGSYYTIENKFGTTSEFPIQVNKITNFGEGESELSGKMLNYQLCLTPGNIYTYDCSTGNTKTHFYRYIHYTPLEYSDTTGIHTIDKAFKIQSKVIWYMKGYHEVELSSIITDWKRL